LRAIRAFEACYRLGSFTRAAGELNVGQPAISHQIKLLEEDLGAALFEKRGPASRPTALADEFYGQVALSLSSLAEASRRIRRRGAQDMLTIATYPGIATFWVLPRLAAHRAGTDPADRPALACRVVTAERDADIDMAEVDAAILFGDGNWPGFESRLLLPERVVPVASPTLARQLKSRNPADLLQIGPLIHLEDPEQRWFTWRDWQKRFAPKAKSIDHSLVVTNHGVAIYQALQGAGVALGWQGVIADLLASGVLVSLYDDVLQSSRGYHLVSRPDWLDGPVGRRLLAHLAPHTHKSWPASDSGLDSSAIIRRGKERS
jgi:DNA-binding transcriptional LysR family regulator